jgi:hypothetical protein
MKKPSTETLEQRRAHAFTCLTQLIEQVYHFGCPTAGFREAHEALETLPLTVAEYATARNRLTNARSYREAGERGAALYELRLLWRSLKK